MAGKSGKENKKGKTELTDILTELAALRHDIEALKSESLALVPSGSLVTVSAEQVARKASAFSPVARARLIEALLTGGPQPPPQLGESCDLATGSLYHHLREIVATGVATVEAKTYRLTPEGERLARAFFNAS